METVKHSNPRYPLSSILRVASYIGSLGTGYYSDEQIAEVMKCAPSTLKQFLSGGQMYHVLELKRGIGYKVTPLYYNIIAKSAEAYLEAIKSPPTFSILMDELLNGKLETLEDIEESLLKNNPHMTESIAKRGAIVFEKNCIDAGLIKRLKKNTIPTNEKSLRLSKTELENAQNILAKETTLTITVRETNREVKICSGNDVLVHIMVAKNYKRQDLEQAIKALEL